jgi:hypothetical protein
VKNLLITSGLLGLLLAINPVALAKYNPENQKPPSSNTNSGGTRSGSCENTEGTPLMILAPFSHIGKTASTRPTFAWFVPTMSKSYKIEFRLYEYDKNNRFQDFGEPILKDSSSGVMSLSLPENQPPLTEGKTYLWQVTLICNENDHSKDILISAEIEVVTMPPNLNTVEIKTTNTWQKVDRYSTEELWYDALAQALPINNNSQLDTASTKLLEELLTVEEDNLLEQMSKLSSDSNKIESSKLKQIKQQLQQIISLRRIITNLQSE